MNRNTTFQWCSKGCQTHELLLLQLTRHRTALHLVLPLLLPSSHPRAGTVISFWKHLSLPSPYFIIFPHLTDGRRKTEVNPLPACEVGTKSVRFIPKPSLTSLDYFLLNSLMMRLTQKWFWDKFYQNSSTITPLDHLKGWAAWRMPLHLHIKFCALVTLSDWGQHFQKRMTRVQFTKAT